MQIDFDRWQEQEILLLSTPAAVTVYSANRFDTVKRLNTIPLVEKTHIFRRSNRGYVLYDNNTKKGYTIENIFSSHLTLTDSFTTEERQEKEKYQPYGGFSVKFIETEGVKTFLFNYGIPKQENINFLDKNIFQYSIQGKVKKIGVYPAGYNRIYRAVRDAFFDIDSSNIVYYALAYSDSVYKTDINGTYLGAARIAECREFDPYENSDLTDLAYKRKYLATSEQNLVVKLVNNQYIVVLRRKKQPQMKDTPAYLVTVFNLQLDKLYQEELKADITPAIFHSGKTIFFLAMDFSKTYGYEIE